VALREWLASFRIYYDASKFEHATDAMKHGYFYACMEDKLAFRVRSAATATSAVLNTPGDDPDPTSLETLLREQFDMQDSLFARRYRLMDNRHKPGTRFTDWMNQYTAESDECDLAAMTPDLFLAGQFTAKCADPELQKELMKTDGTLKAIRETAVAYERRSADLGTYKDKASSGSSGHISAIRGDCQRCGGTCPSGAKCPADDSSCMYCGKRGHWAGVCRKRQSDDNSGRRKSPDRGRSHGRQSDDNSGRRKSPDRGRSHSRKPKKTDYKKAKERGQSYTGRSDDSDSDGGASKGARPKRGSWHQYGPIGRMSRRRRSTLSLRSTLSCEPETRPLSPYASTATSRGLPHCRTPALAYPSSRPAGLGSSTSGTRSILRLRRSFPQPLATSWMSRAP
jgi:hypothetical protein